MLSELQSKDFSEWEYIPNGYDDMQQVPKASDANFRKLVERHNQLVGVMNDVLSVVNNLLDKE